MLQNLIEYYMTNGAMVVEQFIRHLLISVYGVLFAALIFIPSGFYLARKRVLGNVFIQLANMIQTIPSLATISILMILVGIGPNTVVLCVFLYSILPILKNTMTAVQNVDENLLDVAKGMGMTQMQIRLKVEFPLALSIILGGLRNALVLAIGITAIGTFIGAGGLGDIISRGINVSRGQHIIWAGALPTILMAFGVDVLLAQIEKRFAFYK